VVWSVTCGTGKGERIVTQVGDARFEVESNVADPAAGHVYEESFRDWAAHSPGGEWVVSAIGTQAQSVRAFSAPSDHDPCSM
jgi:hypothetical protein